MRSRRPLTLALATATLVVVGALPAGAHPSFADGASAPAGSLTTLTLSMAHGCGTEDDAGGDPTTEVSVEVPAAFSYLEPLDVDGYEVTVEDGDRPELPEVVTWTATDGGEPAPELPMEVVVEGEVGDEVYVRVFQSCDGFAYRWVGTPDEPADDPAVRLTLGEPDPDAPPPPAPEDTGPPEDAATEEPGASDDEVAAEDGAVDDEDAPAVEELPTEPPEDEVDGFGWGPLLLGALVLAGLGALLGARLRRPVPDTTEGDGTGMAPPTDEV